MENAAKALIIAGTILLTMLLLSLFVYVSRDMAESASDIYASLEESEISEYNQQFLNYDKRQDLNIQDVVTIINLAKNQNEIQKVPVTVTVTLDGKDVTNADIYQQLKKENFELEYKCKVSYVDKGTLVNKVELTQIKEDEQEDEN